MIKRFDATLNRDAIAGVVNKYEPVHDDGREIGFVEPDEWEVIVGESVE